MATPPLANGELPLQASSNTVLLNGITSEHHDSPPPHNADGPANGEQQSPRSTSPDTPDELEPFDWKDFEARYQAALSAANEEEKAVLKEAESLSKVWLVGLCSMAA